MPGCRGEQPPVLPSHLFDDITLMGKSPRVGTVLGSIALAMALVSFALGSAPFTPALVLIFAAIPLALISGILGAWRLAVTSFYFSCAAWLTLPVAREASIRVDYLIAAFAVVGIGLAGILFYGYVASRKRQA